MTAPRTQTDIVIARSCFSLLQLLRMLSHEITPIIEKVAVATTQNTSFSFG
jgi:hypothetical protein